MSSRSCLDPVPVLMFYARDPEPHFFCTALRSLLCTRVVLALVMAMFPADLKRARSEFVKRCNSDSSTNIRVSTLDELTAHLMDNPSKILAAHANIMHDGFGALPSGVKNEAAADHTKPWDASYTHIRKLPTAWLWSFLCHNIQSGIDDTIAGRMKAHDKKAVFKLLEYACGVPESTPLPRECLDKFMFSAALRKLYTNLGGGGGGRLEGFGQKVAPSIGLGLAPLTPPSRRRSSIGRAGRLYLNICAPSCDD